MDIKKSAISGIKWSAFSTLVLAVAELLKIAVLTRFLEKKDFGLMALVLFVMGFMTLFNDMGLTTAILHKQDITKKQYSSLYWLNWFISFVIYGLLLLITPVTASFYNQPLLNVLIPLIGLNLFFSGLGNQYRTIEQKNLLFKTISIIDVIAAIMSLLLAVFLAYNNFGVYALVYSLLFRIGFSNLLYFVIGVKKHGLGFTFTFSETKPFLKIGIYQVGSQIVNYFNRDLDILIIGKFFSADILGGYSLARELVRKPSALINTVLNRVGGPTLSKYVNNTNRLKKYYLKMTNILASITIPIYVLFSLLAYPLVYFLYDSSFLIIVPLVQILSINMIFRVIGGNIGNLVVATGRTDLDLKWNVITLLVIPIFVFLGSQISIIGVATMVTFSNIILFIPAFYLLVYPMLSNCSLSEYSKSFFIIKKIKF